MMREMSHRVKNSLMLVTGMLAMQARGTEVAEVKQALTDAEARVATIAAMHDHLWRQIDVETIELADFLKGLCERLAQTSDQHALVFKGTPCRIDADGAIQVALLVNELVTNAFKHAYPSGGGRIDVNLEIVAEEIRLAVSDQGVGLPRDFNVRESPHNSLGMRVISGLVRQLKARLAVEDAAPGARFAIHIPGVLKT
jgi:two-component sensor histidine kinase